MKLQTVMLKILTKILLLTACSCLNIELLQGPLCSSTGGLLNNFCVYENKSNNNTYIMASANAFGKSTDNRGLSYKKILPNNGDEEAEAAGIDRTFKLGYGNINKIIKAENSLVAVSDLNRIFASYDQGETWHYNPNIFHFRWAPVTGGVVNKKFLPLNSIDYNAGRYIAVGHRSVMLIGDDGALGEYRHIDCETAFDDIPADDLKKCNLFFEGIVYGDGYWVLWGGAEGTSPRFDIIFYSDDNGDTWKHLNKLSEQTSQQAVLGVKFYKDRWYFVMNSGRLRFTEDSDPNGSTENWPRHSEWGSVKVNSNFTITDKHKIRVMSGGRDDSSLVLDDSDPDDDNGGLRHCEPTGPIEDAQFCTFFNPWSTGVPNKFLFSDGLWYMLTSNGYYYVSETGYEWYQYRFGFESLNDIISL